VKKIIALALSLLIVLSLFAGCAKGGSNETTAPEVKHTLSVGFGRTNISPTEPVPLGGYGNTSNRLSQTVREELYATCVAMTDEAGNTVLLYHIDLVSAPSDAANLRMSIGKKVGVPGANVFLSATHNHSAPDTHNSLPSMQRYNEMLKERLIEAAQAAMADRKEATMHIARAYPTGLNFVRHYWLSDGTSFGDNHGYLDEGDTYVKHTSEADNQLQMVKFVREGAEDVVLVNWQAHPHRGAGGGKATHVSSDLIGIMRDYVEQELGCKFAYYSGAGGNMNSSSRISGENAAADYKEHGKMLGQYVIDNYDKFTQVDVGTVQVKSANVTLKHNHEQEDLLSIANQMVSMWLDTGEHGASRELGRPYGIHSVYHANAIRARPERGESGTVPISAFSIGDVAFATAPYEMFDTNGKQIKDTSSFDMTFVVCYCNGSNGYIPSQAGYDYGCYEADTTKFAPGSGEVMEQAYKDLLKTLYETK